VREEGRDSSLEPNSIGNFFVKAIVNSPLHPLLGESFAVVTVEGRRTGRRYSVPIGVWREGDTVTAVSHRVDRNWWRNLRGGRVAQLRVSGKQYAVRGEILERKEDVVAGLTSYLMHFSGRSRKVNANYFGIRLGEDERPRKDDLERAAGDRVIIRFHPAKDSLTSL